jgi:hypothetical protein
MSASSPRRLLFLLLVVSLAFPSHASAATWDFGNLLAKARELFSTLWTSEESAPDAKPVRRGAYGKHLLADTGCVILPDGRCGA